MNLIHLLFSCPLPHLCLCSYGLVLLIVNKFGFFAHPIWVKCGVNPCLTIAVVMVVGRRHLFLLLLLSFPRLVKSFSRLDWRRTFAKLILPSVCELNLGSPTSANTAGCTRTLVSGRRHSLPLLIKRRRHTGNFDCNVFFLFSRFWFNFPFSWVHTAGVFPVGRSFVSFRLCFPYLTTTAVTTTVSSPQKFHFDQKSFLFTSFVSV